MWSPWYCIKSMLNQCRRLKRNAGRTGSQVWWEKTAPFLKRSNLILCQESTTSHLGGFLFAWFLFLLFREELAGVVLWGQWGGSPRRPRALAQRCGQGHWASLPSSFSLLHRSQARRPELRWVTPAWAIMFLRCCVWMRGFRYSDSSSHILYFGGKVLPPLGPTGCRQSIVVVVALCSQLKPWSSGEEPYPWLSVQLAAVDVVGFVIEPGEKTIDTGNNPPVLS